MIHSRLILSLFLLISNGIPAFAQNAASTTAFITPTGILPLTYQSKSIQFSDWISLFTLCLSPFLAHVIAGVPDTVHLCRRRPSWHDRLCHYNPTSILWRYFIILDRRVRVKAWNAADMAASNANFWTSRGWDGSEEMMRTSRAFSTRLPSTTRTTILSSSFFKTVIISIQGVQAIYTLAYSAGGRGNYTDTIAVDSIFFPLAVFGLLRLLAALWLTDEFMYTDQDVEDSPDPHSTYKLNDLNAAKPPAITDAEIFSTTSLLEPPSHESPHFHPISSWRARAVRVLYLLPILGILTICVVVIFGFSSHSNTLIFSVSNLVMSLFYFLLLASTSLVFAVYFLRGRTTTSCIPCINSMWYKIYTGILVALILVLIVITSIETRRSSCGPYTTYPTIFDEAICLGSFPVISKATDGPFAVATWISSGENVSTMPGEEGPIRVVYFDGWCQGKAGALVNNSVIIEGLNTTGRP